jgi:hypothetical protein
MIEVHVPSQEKWVVMYMCVRDIDFVSVSSIFQLDFGTILVSLILFLTNLTKYMAVFHFLKSTSNDVTDVYFNWRHTR